MLHEDSSTRRRAVSPIQHMTPPPVDSSRQFAARQGGRKYYPRVPILNSTYWRAVSNTKLKRPSRVGWMLAAALILCGSTVILARWFNWTPLALPVDLKPGTTRSPEFRVTREAPYLVTLEVDRSIPTNRLYCLLGGVPWQPPCAGDPTMEIHWTLWNGSQQVASGNSQNAGGWNSDSTVTRSFGQFNGSPGTGYVLEVTSMLDGSALAAARPRIVVQIRPDVTKGYHVAFLLGAPFALTFLVFGALWLVSWASDNRTSRRDLRT